MPAARPMEQRFWEKVDRNGPVPTGHADYEGLGPCWLFTGSRGNIAVDRSHLVEGSKRISAWRYVWTLHFGHIPEGQVVRHKCDNGHLFCVNPGHLQLGTQVENARDRYRRRHVPMRVLSTDMAAAIVEAYESYDVPIPLLARVANVALYTVNRTIYDGRRSDVRGAAPRRKAPPLTDEDFARVQALVGEGKSLRAAGLAIGRDWNTVRSAYTARGLDYQRRPRFTAEEEATVRRVIAEGRSINAAAHAIGRSWPHVRRFVSELGLDGAVNPDPPRESHIGEEKRAENARRALATRWARKRGTAA